MPSAEGYRITWVHSTVKAARDAATRGDRIEAGIAAVEALDAKLAGPRSRYKTRVAVEQAAAAALAQAHADRWVTAAVTQTTAKKYKQARRGRPGPETSYREITTNRFALAADIDLDHITHDAASDGCFPLITNDANMSDAQVLAAYRYQPNLERRHHLLKSVQDAAPVLLKNPARIEGLFCCQFLALLVAALIERQVRTAMAAAALDNIPLYPELRDCTAPSTQRILEIFTNLARHQLHHDGVLVKTFEPELTTQQQQILDLLGLAPTAYTQHRKLPR
jgi:transposase